MRMYQKTIDNNRILNFLLILLYFFLQAADSCSREMGLKIAPLGPIKVVLLITAIALLALQKKRTERIFFKELCSQLYLVIGYTILSAYFIIKNGAIYNATFIGLLRISITPLIVFFLLNVVSREDITKILQITFWLMFLSYLFTLKGRIHFAFSFSLMDSTGMPTESDFYSPIAIGLCIFFCFICRKRTYMLLSLFFVFLTYKRIMILFAFFWILFSGVLLRTKKMPYWFTPVFGVFYYFICIFYIRIVNGQASDFFYKKIGVDVDSLTMGRAWLMRSAMHNFVSHGLYSSTVNRRSMEMDIPMVYLEMGSLAVVITVICILLLVQRNWATLSICFFCLLELLTSHWLDISSFWIVFYICIGYLNKDLDESLSSKSLHRDADTSACCLDYSQR